MRHGVAFSGIPDSDGGEDDEDELFEVADNLDLGAVDLCVSVVFPFERQEVVMTLVLPVSVLSPVFRKNCPVIGWGYHKFEVMTLMRVCDVSVAPWELFVTATYLLQGAPWIVRAGF